MRHETRVRRSAFGLYVHKSYGPATTSKCGTTIRADTFGDNMPVKSAPVHPVQAFDEWISKRNRWGSISQHGKAGMTGAKVRRILIMRREGCTWKECGEAVGVCGGRAKEWLDTLPLELSQGKDRP